MPLRRIQIYVKKSCEKCLVYIFGILSIKKTQKVYKKLTHKTVSNLEKWHQLLKRQPFKVICDYQRISAGIVNYCRWHTRVAICKSHNTENRNFIFTEWLEYAFVIPSSTLLGNDVINGSRLRSVRWCAQYTLKTLVISTQKEIDKEFGRHCLIKLQHMNVVQL